MPCTCGCYIENYCSDPTVSRSDYNNFQNNNYILGGYILHIDGWSQKINGKGNWRAGRSTSTVINDQYRSKNGPKYCIEQFWPDASNKLQDMIYKNRTPEYLKPIGNLRDMQIMPHSKILLEINLI